MIKSEQSKAIRQLLFAGRHLGILHSELKIHMDGEAMPPTEVLLRGVELVIAGLKGADESVAQALR